jgi:protein TonB
MSATLTALVAERAEQSASLRYGITLSAGIHLTLAVLLFGALGLTRGAPKIVLVDPRGPHNPTPPPPDPRPPNAPRVFVPNPDKPGEYKLVDEFDPPPVDTSLVTEPTGVIGIDTGILGGNDSPIGDRSGEVVEDVLPPPNEFVFRDIEPEVVHRVVPAYPAIAQQAGLEGRVVVRVLVDKAGAVRKVEIERSSEMFDDAALQAVRQWTFRPAIASGNPVAVWVRIPIDFRMK